MILVQLFARSGVLVDTVMIPRQAEVISWKDKYYSIQTGRYVEGDLLVAMPATATAQQQPREVAPVTATAGGFVETRMTMR